MTTFNTGNPIGSTDARDLSDNAENFDVALGTISPTWVDRLGNTRDSFEGRLAKGSFYRVGTFSAGYTLTNMRQTLEYYGLEYSWSGSFPKAVHAGSTPATSGGVGAGAWVDRTDATLRDQLAGDGGATKVGTSDGRTVEQRLAALPNEVDAAGTAASLIDQHNNDYFAHTHLTEQIASAVGRAETAVERAETARDSAMVIGNLYVDTATGLAAVSEGAYFSVAVVASNDIKILYRKVSGSAVEIGRYPSSTLIANALDSNGYNESGYAWALVDSQNKIAFAVRKDGSVEIGNQIDVESTLALVSTFAPSAALIDTYFEEYGTHSGYAWALVDSADNMIICVRKDGKLEVAGYYLARQVDLDALNTRIYGSSKGKSIVAWGDSLTEGSGGTPYPQQLSTLLSTTVINEGFGGQTTKKIIARQGGASALATVSSNSIPASGSVAVTLDVSLLSYPTSSSLSITGYLNGILGTLTKDTSNNYSFARSVAGSATITPPNTPFVVTKSTRNTSALQLDYGINLFWCGSNDVGTSTINEVAALIDQAVAHLKTSEKRFVILGPINNSAYTSSTQAYVDMRAVTNQIKAKYPANFIDIQELLLCNYNPGIPQDVTDFENKVVPSSLRADAIHLNTAGYAIVANAVKSFIDAKGWLS